VNKLTKWLISPFLEEEFGAPAGTLPSPSQKKIKKAKKKLDKYGQRSVYSEDEIEESLPTKVTDKFKKVKSTSKKDIDKDFVKHHQYSMGADSMGNIAEPDTYDWDDDDKEKGGHQKEKDKKKKGYEPVTEQKEIKKTIAIYPGRFQPFGPHHKAVFDRLKRQFDDVYIVTSDIKKPPRHPLNFREKKAHMVKMGVPAKNIFKSKQPYKPVEVFKYFDENETAAVFALGKKDASRLSGGKYFQPYKKGGDMNGFLENGYVMIAPHVSVKLAGEDVSGTVMRKVLGSNKISEPNRKKLFKKLFGYSDNTMYKLLTTRFKSMNEIIEKFLSESNVSTIAHVDDGPVSFYANFADYMDVSKDWLGDLGAEVIDYIVSNKAQDPAYDPLLKTRIVSAVAHGTTLSPRKSIARYKNHINNRVLQNIGFEVVKWMGLKSDTEVTGVSVLAPVAAGADGSQQNTDRKKLSESILFETMTIEEGVRFDNFLKDFSKKAKQPFSKIKQTMNNKNTFVVAKLNDFSVDKVLDSAKRGFQAYQKILNVVPNKIAKKLAGTKFGQKKEKALKKLDNFLQKNPKLKKVMGLGAASAVTYAWTKMTFIGDPEYDLDLSAVASAASGGDYSLADMFGGEMGTKFLVLTAVGATTGLTAPYTKILGNVGTMAAGLGFGAIRAYKKKKEAKKKKEPQKTKMPDTVKNPNPRGRKKMISKQSAVRWVAKNKGNKAAQKYQKSLSETKLFSPDWWTQELQEKELLLMGGAAGHMSHPFDNHHLTFGDFKNIIDMSLQGKLNREDKVTEKLDGQNLMISWKNNKLVAARNKGNLKNFGESSLDVKGMKSKFAGRGDVEKAFVGAMKDLESAVNKLSEKQKEKVFGEGKRWMNLEIVYPKTANVIDYDVSELFFHGSVEVDESGQTKKQVKDSARMLEGMIRQINQNIQKRFKISKPVILNLPKVQDYAKKKKYFLGKLRKLQTIYKLKDNDTLGMYHEMYWREYIFNASKQMKYKIPKNVLDSLTRRWAFLDKSFRLDKKNIKHDKFLEWSKATDKFDLKKLQQEHIKPFELLFLELGAEILKNLDGYLAVNPQKAVKNIKKDLKSAISALKSSKDIKTLNLLKKNLEKIQNIGGSDSIVPSEGLVFKYNGDMYKFTGAFAPVNQILGALKFVR